MTSALSGIFHAVSFFSFALLLGIEISNSSCSKLWALLNICLLVLNVHQLEGNYIFLSKAAIDLGTTEEKGKK